MMCYILAGLGFVLWLKMFSFLSWCNQERSDRAAVAPFHRPPPLLRRPCSTKGAKSFEYCNASLSDEERIASLMSALHPEEKISMLGNKVPSIRRLSLPPYNWWNEALHGVSFSCCPDIYFKSTSFPQVCSLGLSFNRSLFSAIGDAIGLEAVEHVWRVGDVPGLTFWSPNVNLFRDPRWGRGQEVPGEDPYLNGEYAAEWIPALQYGLTGEGRGGGKPRVAAACKHFAAYSLETGRRSFDARVDERDLNDSYLPMFKRCVESGALGLMCSYNAINGVPSCASAELLTNKLRTEWGFEGYVTGDCSAVESIFTGHKYANSTEEAVAIALRAGLSSDCGGAIQSRGMAALNSKLVSMEDINRALRDLLRLQFRLGYYNNLSSPVNEPSEGLGSSRQRLYQVRMHNELALEAARQGIVLLKNGPLPFNLSNHHSIGLFGPNADSPITMQGNYFGEAPYLITPKQGFEDMGAQVRYLKGCNVSDDTISESDEICKVAATADASVLIMGMDQTIESEGRDRVSLTLPGAAQDKLIRLVSSCSQGKNTKKPVILIIMAGGPIDLSSYKDEENVDSILYVGYPGQAGGSAIAECLWGQFNPSGRLTTTIYPQEYAQLVDLGDMRMRPSPSDGFPGRTHRFYVGNVVYPFGYGLSYSHFKRRLISSQNQSTDIEVEVSNEGPIDGSHSILLFHSGPSAGKEGNPIQTLVGFSKVTLVVGETRTTAFSTDEALLQKPGVHKFFLLADNEDGERTHKVIVD